MKLGERIAGWRQAKGLTERELAERLGVTPPAIYQWENGTTSPSVANLQKLGRAFGISMEEFYGKNAPRPRKEVA